MTPGIIGAAARGGGASRAPKRVTRAYHTTLDRHEHALFALEERIDALEAHVRHGKSKHAIRELCLPMKVKK